MMKPAAPISTYLQNITDLAQPSDAKETYHLIGLCPRCAALAQQLSQSLGRVQGPVCCDICGAPNRTEP